MAFFGVLIADHEQDRIGDPVAIGYLAGVVGVAYRGTEFEDLASNFSRYLAEAASEHRELDFNL